MSDLLIKGVETPRSCGNCFFDTHCDNWRLRNWGAPPPDDCPLVPVPPHGRLGDLDKLEQMFADIDHAPYSGFDGEDPFYSAADAAQIIRLAPTIIPAEEGQ